LTIKHTVICRCEGVKLEQILSTIQAGAKNTKELKLITRTGMGVCQGKVCRPLLEELIANQTGQPIQQKSKLTNNYPIRSLTLEELARHRKDT